MSKSKKFACFITMFFLAGLLYSCAAPEKKPLQETQITDPGTVDKNIHPLKIKNSVVKVAPDSNKAVNNNTDEAPSIFLESSHFDFGEIFEGKEIKHSFIVKNTGTGILQIKSVRPG